jgi:4'-phosphopantetheinyl transferase EntD
MAGDAGSAFEAAVQSLGGPDLLIGSRLIAAGDELSLLDAETISITTRRADARRASASARIVARELLARLDVPQAALPKGATGAPVWPPGVVGSLAHDRTVAVAVVGRRSRYASIGVDIESSEPLDADMLDLVVTPRERRAIGDDAVQAKQLFVAKEAVYKAVHPLDGAFLEYHDIEVDLTAGRAVVRNGRTVALRTLVSAHLVALVLVA